MSFESELRDTLRRKTPPPGFTGRVMAAVTRDQQQHRAPLRRVGWLAAAAAMVTITFGGYVAHRIEQKREGERAKAQLMLALHLTSKKLRNAQQHVQDVSVR